MMRIWHARLMKTSPDGERRERAREAARRGAGRRRAGPHARQAAWPPNEQRPDGLDGWSEALRGGRGSAEDAARRAPDDGARALRRGRRGAGGGGNGGGVRPVGE